MKARSSVIRKLVYQSDFTKPDGWDERHSSRVKAFRCGGYYHIAVYNGAYGAWSGPLDVVDSFKAQLDVELNFQSGKTAECGMVFCAEEACDTYFFFAFTVRPDGVYRLCRVLNTKATFIIDWKSSEMINKGLATNSLSIEKKRMHSDTGDKRTNRRKDRRRRTQTRSCGHVCLLI